MKKILAKYSAVVTVEEQLLDGGFGSAVAEVFADGGIFKPMKRLGLKDGFAVVNGNRDHLHKLYNIDTIDIVHAVTELIKNV